MVHIFLVKDSQKSNEPLIVIARGDIKEIKLSNENGDIHCFYSFEALDEAPYLKSNTYKSFDYNCRASLVIIDDIFYLSKNCAAALANPQMEMKGLPLVNLPSTTYFVVE